jgi:hypothetical protein
MIYCRFCQHSWKIQREYDKHLNCCEYFYLQRRNPQADMDDQGNKLPSVKDLFRYVKDLSIRLERTEKELAKVKSQMNVRQKKAIIEWLNQPNQLPSITFEEWYKSIEVNESHVLCVGERDLTVGMQMAFQDMLQHTKSERLPIRAFSQKPNLFYVYSREDGWRIITNLQIETMLLHLSQLFLREFLKWQKKEKMEKPDENDVETEKNILFMMKINGMRTTTEKRIQDIRKWLFPKLEENLRVVMECEFV